MTAAAVAGVLPAGRSRRWAPLRTAGRAALGVWLVSVGVFVVARVLPRSPAEVHLQARGLPVTPDAVAALRRAWGLDLPVVQQYLHWAGGLLRGDWGTSTTSGASVGQALAAKLPLSLGIGLGGLLLAWALAYPLGMLAVTRGGAFDALTRVWAVAAQAVPSFVVAVGVVEVLSVRLGWVSFFRLTGPAQLVAPAVLAGLFATGVLARVVAAHARDVAGQPFVTAELGRGFDRGTVLWRHGRRQVLHGLVAASVAKLPVVIGGAAVLEFAFAVPGTAVWVASAVADRDYAVVQAYLLVVALWMAVGHVLADAAMAALDPRVRP